MSSTLSSLSQLRDAGLVSDQALPGLEPVAHRYAVGVTEHVASLIDPADPADPVARQYVPSPAELERAPGEQDDPIGDGLKSPLRGIVHRHADRVLLKAVGVCPVYCRFCFRRETVGPGHGSGLTQAELDAAIDYIAADPGIWEVILTGGDPLVLSPRRIRALAGALGAIAHVKVLRWHTRMPVASPERVTDALAQAITCARPVTWVAIHANHARELDAAARAACERLRRAGAILISQSVLLRGVNDDASELERLMRAFVEAGVKPYYLHHPDLAPGTAHFRVSLETGRRLMRELRQRLSGLAMPCYVLDIPGAHGKVPVGPGYLLPDAQGEAGAPASRTVLDAAGRRHRYQDIA